jgi:hypothetical protein
MVLLHLLQNTMTQFEQQLVRRLDFKMHISSKEASETKLGNKIDHVQVENEWQC